MNHETARDSLSALLTSLGLSFFVVRMNPGENGERDTMRYRFILSAGKDVVIEGDYSVGSAIPLHGHKVDGRNVADAGKRAALRAVYKPGAVDVLGSLLSDDSLIDEYETEGQFVATFAAPGDAQSIDKTLETFRTIRARRIPLRRMLGAKLDEARGLASEL